MRLPRVRVPPPPRISRPQAYLAAVAIPLVTLAIQHELMPLVHLVPFILFFLAVFLVSWLGGRGPGFVAIAVSAAAADYHFLPPYNSFSIDARSLILIGLFCLVSTIVNLLTTAAAEAYTEAQQAIRLRDDFLSVAGHELRTPLTTLQLQIETLARLDRSDPGAANKHVERAERSVNRLVQLIDELLDVSRIRAGRLQMHFESCDLCEITLSVVDQMRDAAARAGCEIDVATPGAIRGKWDRTRIEQVISNLLGNAIKFGSGKPISVRLTLDANVARLSVGDQGIGIPEEDQARIFGRFEQVRSSHQAGGLGLGLWIAQRIIDAHGGAISVKSKPGEGATFTVDLPLSVPG